MTLDELTALCDEMMSLSRAGIPLDRGLLKLADDLPKRMSVEARAIGEKLQAGESLADVVAADETPFPVVYKSVVEAGLRSGKLTVALEGFSRIARHKSDVRRLVIASLVYPLLLLFLTFVISFGLLGRFGSSVAYSMVSISGRGSEASDTAGLLQNYETWSRWFWVLPAILLAIAAVWIVVAYFSRGAGGAEWIPGVGRLLRNSRLMGFTEVLRLLVQQRVPLHQAVRLAGATSGDHRLQKDAELLSEQLERGDNSSDAMDAQIDSTKGGIPPFVRWSLLHRQKSDQLETTLDRAHQTYKKRTEVASIWLRRTLPIMLSAALGGVVSFLYAATVFLPWYTMLKSLSGAMEAL